MWDEIIQEMKKDWVVNEAACKLPALGLEKFKCL